MDRFETNCSTWNNFRRLFGCRLVSLKHILQVFLLPKKYDVVVVGAGHAGVEAALAAARLGCTTAILTQNADTIAQMSCNPAIGGLAKGHMVREIDALGGAMGLNADSTAIQCRLLNASKGASVRAPRSQCDKKAYQFRMKWVIESQEGLDLIQGNVIEILRDDNGVSGVRTHLGLEISARSVVITTGTFMRGLLHVGMQNATGGRMGDSVSTLSDSLRQLGFEVGRFKTGTPCRLNSRSIDFSKCQRQDGDTPPPAFTFMEEWLEKGENAIFHLNDLRDGKFHVEQMPCWITHTNQRTHAIIRENLHLSPLYAGKIEGVGPRYCPSIEDKVVKFAEKSQHQLFLEPEGRQTLEYYVNGISTSLPYEVQYAFIRSIAGLENAEIMRPGYAVEYDYCPPTQLKATLETKLLPGLYFAGQINGTSGYEEAGAQGLIAGANAGLQVLGKPSFILGREEAYIGVMIDDLITKGVTEPYRMFTSRAEFRLLLRQDTADLRLTPRAAEAGLVCGKRVARVEERRTQLAEALRISRGQSHQGVRVEKLLRRPDVGVLDLPETLRGGIPLSIWEMLETDLKYEGYIQRQELALGKARNQESKRFPEWIDFNEVPGLRQEARQKLSAIRPETLGQAGRISGITPSDVTLLTIWIERGKPAIPV